MKNLFIDSNIWLSLYHFTNDDLTQFEKLKESLGKEIRLWIPQQVYDEVLRNREAKIQESFKSFEVKSIQYPVFCQQYEEYTQFKIDYADIMKRYKAWKAKLDRDIQEANLPADKTIKLLFNSAGLINCDSVISKAYSRYRIGNPPGKDNKYGDAVNWECLLESVPDGEDLYFISADKDYRSIMFDSAFNPFLKNEWNQKKNSQIHYYKTLVSFLKENAEEIELRTESEKQELIERLNKSRNFISTHGIIALMKKYSGWTDAQVEEICEAAEDNTQVKWLLGDDDVYDFYTQLLANDRFYKKSDCAISRMLENLNIITQERKHADDEDLKYEVFETIDTEGEPLPF